MGEFQKIDFTLVNTYSWFYNEFLCQTLIYTGSTFLVALAVQEVIFKIVSSLLYYRIKSTMQYHIHSWLVQGRRPAHYFVTLHS